MPPPNSLDSWLSSRRFGIVIDAGSSGSRLQIYSWIDARTVRRQGGRLDILPKVERGTRELDKWIVKAEPGLATFADNLQGIGPYLAPLLAHAREHVPPSIQDQTPVFLLATAGMRLLPPEKQKAVLAATCDFLRFHSNFKVEAPSARGPCGSHVTIISGEEEGLFGWIAINYLMDGFQESEEDAESSTYGFLDMGGASTQIAFEPRKSIRQASDEPMHEVRLRLIRGDELKHTVFVTTWLGYGTNQARERYVGEAINAFELHESGFHNPTNDDHIPDPCLPKDLQRRETPVHIGESTSHTRKSHLMIGTGSFEDCLKRTTPLLNKTVTCKKAPCLFNGVHVPHIDFSVSKFIGVSEYWYSSEHVFGLGGAYNFVDYERAASEFCSSDWSKLKTQHEKARKSKHLGGDGEVEDHGKVVEVGKWGADVELSRLELQCFKAAWIVNVLHEGIGVPRTVDPGGNVTAHGKTPNQKAALKGLGAPTFQSLDVIDDTAISWALGKMVLEASKEVPALSPSLPQLPDPLDPIGVLPLNQTQKQPETVVVDWSDRLKQHRSSLPLSLLFSFYLLLLFGLTIPVYLLRRHIKARWRRFIRRNLKKEDLMEEGQFINGNGRLVFSTPHTSRPPSPDHETTNALQAATQSLRRAVSRVTVSSSTSTSRSKPMHRPSSPTDSPPMTATFPIFPQNPVTYGPPVPPSGPNGNGPVDASSLSSSHPLSSLSLSRTSSQISLVPRQNASRSGSGTPTKATDGVA